MARCSENANFHPNSRNYVHSAESPSFFPLIAYHWLGTSGSARWRTLRDRLKGPVYCLHGWKVLLKGFWLMKELDRDVATYVSNVCC